MFDENTIGLQAIDAKVQQGGLRPISSKPNNTASTHTVQNSRDCEHSLVDATLSTTNLTVRPAGRRGYATWRPTVHSTPAKVESSTAVETAPERVQTVDQVTAKLGAAQLDQTDQSDDWPDLVDINDDTWDPELGEQEINDPEEPTVPDSTEGETSTSSVSIIPNSRTAQPRRSGRLLAGAGKKELALDHCYMVERLQSIAKLDQVTSFELMMSSYLEGKLKIVPF
ncbi:hypothetical protein R1sor_011624 [Riccia sorocarpa]|uniref:Uncharacterized protein n=1 Tax=Riccia sorocarpa TaxID=122646 RepID=A0ABD3I1I1_9MARC